jgi:osmotically-inducible protein OsmY
LPLAIFKGKGNIQMRQTSLRLIFALTLAAGLYPAAVAQVQPDNTKVNKDQGVTADKQKEATSDRELAQKVRKAIVADKSLSTYAHNVKVVVQDGKVTLRGPVRSDEERHAVESKATEIAGTGNVTNDLSVKSGS